MEAILKKYILYIFVIILAFGFGLSKTIPMVGNYFSLNKDVKSKQTSIEDLKKNVEIARQNSQEREGTEVKQEKQIYEPQFKSTEVMVNFNGMLDTILELAKQSGLKIKSIEFKDIPESDLIKQNHVAEYDATLLVTQVIGTYTELQNFLREIYRHQYLIGVYDLKVVPYEFDKKILIIDLSLSLYAKK